MNNQIIILQNKIKYYEHQLKEAKEKLQNLINSCNHQFPNPVYEPVVSCCPPLNPITLHRWKRTCSKCGYFQVTSNYNTVKLPLFTINS